jgi:hypothetical protein
MHGSMTEPSRRNAVIGGLAGGLGVRCCGCLIPWTEQESRYGSNHQYQ